ncbi:hypothetical protein BOX15_Mlig018434g1 [Macrostomum lignano]|uniref:Diacylglycerol kinase n=1 Tax=Macrostomum lignano TaxID=282301 RepID=A0A267EEW4_9PLAT|nr:hypothetical protein BOX15_Mlig018434g1 [Macrostomum lignano]
MPVGKGKPKPAGSPGGEPVENASMPADSPPPARDSRITSRLTMGPIPIVVEHIADSDGEEEVMADFSLDNPYCRSKHRSNSYDVTGCCQDELQPPSSPDDNERDSGGNVGGSGGGGASGGGSGSGRFFRKLAIPSLHRKRGRSLEIPRICVHCAYLEELEGRGAEAAGTDSDSNDSENGDQQPSAGAAGSSGGGNLLQLPSQAGVHPAAAAASCSANSNLLQVPTEPFLGPAKNRSSSMDAAWCRRKASTQSANGLELEPQPIRLTVPAPKPRATSFDVSFWSRVRHRRDSAWATSPPQDPGINKATALVQFMRAFALASAASESATSALRCRRQDQQQQRRRRQRRSRQSLTGELSAGDGVWDADRRDWKSSMDWSPGASQGEHVWLDRGSGGDPCYVGDSECCKIGSKKKCAICKIFVHTGCAPVLEKMLFRCKLTFRDSASVEPVNFGAATQDEVLARHHWVHRRRPTGKCKSCGKTFQQKFAFNANKDVVAIACSWCKAAYHNKIGCFTQPLLSECCSLGPLASITVPPAWIVKLAVDNESLDCFRLQTTPGQPTTPIVVLINPKSGGNQGPRLMRKFQWLLNPRQVFDLTACGGPRLALELYRGAPNLRLLVCGGDGTVGWVLSTIDNLGIEPGPPVAILPLGTGNDLARTLGWGSGYADESLTKVLCCVEEGRIAQLDRWNISFAAHPSSAASQASEDEEQSPPYDQPPLNVFNNYFSLGADAAVALEFHESREANPERFNSRLRNMMFYAGEGSRSVITRQWRDLSQFVGLECDGTDYTDRIRELRATSILFLNIAKYSAGATPWGSPACSQGFEPQRHDDGSVEVIGFSSSHLATVQMGGHGHRLCQCKTARVSTMKPIPIQIDGEPWRLQPSVIDISWRNQTRVVMKPKRRGSVPVIADPLQPLLSQPPGGRLRIQVSAVSIDDFERLQFDKPSLMLASDPLGIVLVEADASLSQVRQHVDRLRQEFSDTCQRRSFKLDNDWLFLDSTNTNRFFRIDKQLESLRQISELSTEDLYLVSGDSVSTAEN